MHPQLQAARSFALVGAVPLLAGLWWAASSLWFVYNGAKISAVITGFERLDGCSKSCLMATISFEYEGSTYHTVIPEGNNTIPTNGEMITVFVDRRSPQLVRSAFGLFFPQGFLLFFGFVFLVPSLFLLRSYKERKILERELRSIGVSTRARVVEVYLNTSSKINKRHPFVIEAQFQNPHTGAMVTVLDQGVWVDPVESGIIGPDQTVEVLFHPSNPERHMIVVPPKRG
jgi:hypothetical protein